MQASSLFMADIILALRTFFPKWQQCIFKRRLSAFLVSDYSRLTTFPWIDQSGYLLYVLLRWHVAGCWACAVTPELFQFETSEQQWIRTSFLCSYLNMLLTQYSVLPWYSSIHFLSISFQKWRKTAKHNVATYPHFSLWESFWYLTLIFCLCFQRILHLWVCLLKLLEKEWEKKKPPLLIRSSLFRSHVCQMGWPMSHLVPLFSRTNLSISSLIFETSFELPQMKGFYRSLWPWK